MKAKIFTLLMAMVLCISSTPNVALAAETTGIENIEETLATEKLPVDAELMYTTVNYGSLTNYYLTDVTVNLNGNNVKSARIKISGNSEATYGCTVTTPDGKTHTKTFAGNGKEYTVDIKDGIEETHHNAGEGTVIEAPVPGVVMRVLKNVGDHVEENEEIVVIEAMKMETPIKSSVSGTITSIMVGQGDKVKTGTEMATVG